MGKNPADQFYWNDWLSDVELQQTSACTKGVWINALCRMWYSKPRGELHGTKESLAKLCICTVDEFKTFWDEAQTLGFCYTSHNSNGVITLRNRRMYREEKSREFNRLRQQRYYDKHKNNPKPDADLTPPSSSSPSSSKNIYSKLSKKIIDYLNEVKGGGKFTYSDRNLNYIIARLDEKWTEEDCKKVIDVKWADPDFNKKYFRPSTLFNSDKFEGYLMEATDGDKRFKRFDEEDF